MRLQERYAQARNAGALAIAAVALLACKDSAPDTGKASDAAGAALQGDIIEHKTELGPVTAVVKVGPKEPVLGDPITLLLEVTAEPGVTVEMPDFGEALGSFTITRYVPRESLQHGKWIATQTYTLDAPMSGKQRIPPLRIEFLDERPGQTSGQGSNTDGKADKPAGESAETPADESAHASNDTVPPAEATDTSTGTDADADGAPGGFRELMTDEIALQVASLLPEDLAKVQLSSPKASLNEPSAADALFASLWFWLVVGGVVCAGLAIGLYVWFERRKTERRVSAYAAAMARLSRLESRGLPEPEQADAWYVELSGIIRRYLEDRYNLRAPELTTEEFLQVARGSGVLSSDHRKLLQDFLTRCDRVKFAGYAPGDQESTETLESARSFLNDTRPFADQSEHGGAA